MKIFLRNIIPQLKLFSDSLDKKALLVEKPWVLVNTDSSYQKLIFKKNGELIMSSNGGVEIGRWEYIPSAKSILLDRNKDKILLNHGFLDNNVLLLKIDGLVDEFFILANENSIPNLDAISYLKKLRETKLSIYEIELNNGMQLEVYDGKYKNFSQMHGLKVSIEAEEIPDGIYLKKSNDIGFNIKKGKIRSLYYYKEYSLMAGGKINVVQTNKSKMKKGDLVNIDGLQINDGKYKLITGKELIIGDGKIVKIRRKWL